MFISSAKNLFLLEQDNINGTCVHYSAFELIGVPIEKHS
jgi:hypothetical protein